MKSHFFPPSLAAAWLLAFLPGAAMAAHRPNVLFIVSEDNSEQIGCYGDTRVHTPHLDGLAKTGVRYERAYVPYFHQLSLDKGYRRCFDASAAMVAALHGAVETAEEYGKVREKFGDTIEVSAQLEALRKLGLNAQFRTDGDEAVLEAEIGRTQVR